MSTESLNDCRAAFEVWAHACKLNIDCTSGNYDDIAVDRFWKGWIACWKVRSSEIRSLSGEPDSIDKAEWLKENYGGCYEMFVDPEALYFALTSPVRESGKAENMATVPVRLPWVNKRANVRYKGDAEIIDVELVE
jgi:hypothetical protein